MREQEKNKIFSAKDKSGHQTLRWKNGIQDFAYERRNWRGNEDIYCWNVFIKKFKEDGIIERKKESGKPRSVRKNENETAVEEMICS